MAFPPKRWLRVAGIFGLSILALLFAFVAALQIPVVSTWMGRKLLGLAPLNSGYSIDIGGVAGNWITSLELRDVRLRHDDRVLAHLDQVRVEYNARHLFGSDRGIRSLTVSGGRVTAQRQGQGWDLAQAFRTSGDTTASGGSFTAGRLDVARVQLMIELRPDSIVYVRDLRVRAQDVVLGDRVLLQLDTLHATVIPPGAAAFPIALATRGALARDVIRLDSLELRSERSTVAGRFVLPRQLDDARQVGQLYVNLSATPLALADVAAFYPGVVPEGRVQLHIGAGAEGRLATATITAQMDTAVVRLESSTLLGVDAPVRFRLNGELKGVDPARILRSAPPGALAGTVDVDLRGEKLTSSDGSATLRVAQWHRGGGRIRSLDVAATVKHGRAQLRVRGALGEAAVHAAGWLRAFDSVPSYRLAGAARRLPGTAGLARALADTAHDPHLDIEFRISGAGATLTGATLGARVNVVTISGGGATAPVGHATIQLDGGRLRGQFELRIAGGLVVGSVSAAVADTMRYRLQGTIDNVAVGRLIADTGLAPVSGRFALGGSGTSFARAALSARVDLDDLCYRERRLEGLAARARLENGRAAVSLTGKVGGGGLAVAGTARPFDSVVTFAVERAALERVDLGSWLGRPDLAGPVTMRARATGRWGPGIRFVRGRATIEPGRLGRIQVAGGIVSAELAAGRLTYDASLRTSEGSLQFTGDASRTAGDRAFRLKGSVDSLDLGLLLGRHGLETRLHARVAASAIGTTLAGARGRLDFELLPSRVNEAALGAGFVRVELADGEMKGRVDLDGRDARLVADISGQLAGSLRHIDATGSLTVERLDRWTRDTSLDGKLHAQFDLRALSDSAGLRGAEGTLLAAGTMGRLQLDSLYVKLGPGAGVVLDTLLVRTNVATLDGGGSLALREDSDADTLRVSAKIGDVSALAGLAHVELLSLDSAHAGLIVTGPPAHRRLAVEGNARRLLYANTLVEHLDAAAAATMNGGSLGAVAGGLKLRGLATRALTVHQAEITGRYDSVLAIEGQADFGHGVRLGLAADGAVRGDTTTVRLERLDLTEGGRDWSLEHRTSIEIRPRQLVIESFDLRATDRALKLNGVLNFAGTSDFTVGIERLELGDLANAGLVSIPGMLDGTLRLSGPAQAPVMDGTLSLALHDGPRGDDGRIQSSFNWTSRGLRVDAFAEHEGSGKLTISGMLPWGFTLAPNDTTARLAFVRQPGDTIHLSVQADSFEIALFGPFLPAEAARGLRGRLATDARITGTPEDPAAHGDVRLSGLAVDLPAIDVRYDRGRLAGKLDGAVWRIDTLLLHSGKHEQLVARGVVKLQPLTDPKLELIADLRDFVVSNAGMLQARASGQVQVSGTLASPSVKGVLHMGHTEFHAPGSAVLDLEDVSLSPEDRLEVARHFGPRVLKDADAPAQFLDRFGLDLDLRLPEQVWFRRKASPKVDVEVTGRVQLRQEPHGEMLFFGNVEPLPGRSTLDVFGRTFELTGGEIILDGPVEQARIAVTAQYQPPTEGGSDDNGVLVTVTATGRVDSLGLEFSSDPSMPREDIVSYIVTGRPASDNPLVARSSGNQGQELVLGQLSEALSEVVTRELGFDVFQIRQEAAQGLVLTAGRYLTPRFFVSLQQPLELGGDAKRLPGTSLGPGFELQYRLRPWLRINMRGGSLPSGILFRGRYAY